jgi:hypothetical protein
MEALLARAQANGMPVPFVAGPSAPVALAEEYVALTNLSIPRPEGRGGLNDLGTDLVAKGETVRLTPEQAAPFLRRDPRRDGRYVPVIRKVAGPESSEQLADFPTRYLSGAQRAPVQDARPDPQGSSRIVEQTAVPEGQSPATAAGPTAGQEGAPRVVDAVDLPPGSATNRGDSDALDVDHELVDRVKAAMPGGR